MKIINPSYEILTFIEGNKILRLIERAGRVCYKSNKSTKFTEACDFVKNLIKRGHESVLEHFNITVHFICNRGFSHELVRHRLASYSQESTRYCSYSQERFGKEITVIKPWWLKEKEKFATNACRENDMYRGWENLMLTSEAMYFQMLDHDASPQEARGVLPIDLKTEVVMTANLREWRHILKLRTSKAAHPSMRELMIPLLKELQERLPVIFDDLS